MLLQNAAAVLLQNATEVYYKVRQNFYQEMRQLYYKIQLLLQIATTLLQNTTDITKCNIYYKLGQYIWPTQQAIAPQIMYTSTSILSCKNCVILKTYLSSRNMKYTSSMLLQIFTSKSSIFMKIIGNNFENNLWQYVSSML